MKITWFIAPTVAVVLDACAQGELVFRNFIPGFIDAPVYDSDCRTRLEGSAYLAQTYVGLSASSLQPLGPTVTFRTGLGAGYISEGIFLRIPDTRPGDPVYVQFRAWEGVAGPTYEMAVASGRKYGFSNIVSAEPGFGTPSPPNVLGIDSFCLIPEPPAWALTLVGGVTLWFALRWRVGSIEWCDLENWRSD